MQRAIPGRDELSLPSTNPEVIEYYAQRKERLEIVHTTHTPSGQIIDWIPMESQGRIATPPPGRMPKRESNSKAVRSTAIDAKFELQTSAAERGPAGTVPILRPRLPLTKKIEESLRKRKVDGRLLSNPGAQPPDPFGFYHGTASAWVECYGCESVLGLWDPHCENDKDHSISQFGIQNYDSILQSLEAGWISCKYQFGDDLTHLFTFYTTNNYWPYGNNVQSYDADFEGWVQVDENVFPGAAVANVDWPGLPAYEMQISYHLHEGNWWFYVGETAIGYYPGSLFGNTPGQTLADHGSWCAFWGEVNSVDSDPSKTTTSMGSGLHAKYGWPWSAYQRDMFIRNAKDTPLGERPTGFLKPQPKLSLTAEDISLYDIQMGGEGFEDFMFFGGSGAGAPSVIVY